MKLSSLAMMLAVTLAGCGKSGKTAEEAPGAPVAMGSDAVIVAGSGSGSDSASGSGSGSGSAMADSGSGSGSGSAMAGSGSAAAGSGDDPTNYPHHNSKFDALARGEARSDFMKHEVVPAMKTEFQKFDKKKYADFGCKTCHGKNARDVKFHMPNPSLPKLDFDALKAGKQKPKIAKWMGEVIEPGMAKILGAELYDQDKNPTGFGCLDCHEQKK